MASKIDYNTLTPDDIRRMSMRNRRRFFDTATEAQVERVTVACTGEAHQNSDIDGCMVCQGARWGRMLRRNADKATVSAY